MTSFKVGTTLSGDDPLEFAELLIEGISDFRDLWPHTGKLYRRTQARRFRTQGASEGDRWPRPSETGEADHYRYVKANILGISLDEVDERALLWGGGRERLRPSFVSSSHPEHVDERRKRSQDLGSRVPYAAIHDEGRGRAPDDLGGHPIPRRSLTSISKRFRRDLLREVADYARRAVQTAESDTPRYTSRQIRGML